MPHLLLLLSLAAPARADVAIEAPSGQRYVRYGLRIEGLDAFPEAVILAADPGQEIHAYRAFHAGGETAWDLSGGGGRDRGMGGPALRLTSAATYESWSTTTNALIEAQRQACDERGEGCAHISRFVAHFPPPAGTVDCGVQVQPVVQGPAEGPDHVVDVYKLVEASATTCRLEKVGQEQSRDGKPITAKAAPTSSQGAPHSGRCSTLAGSAASVLAGLGLLLGLTRRKGPAAG